jgi:ribonuclease HI
MIRLFTDGSSINNGKKNSRAGYAVVYPDRLPESWGDILPSGGSQTNQTAELTAIYEGLRAIPSKEDSTAHVYTDSEYSINCLTKWVTGWKKRDWKTADGKPVVHRELIEKIMVELKKFSGHIFTHVKAHTGGDDEESRYNQIADDLARKAVETGGRVNGTDLTVKVIRTGNPTDTVLTGIPLAIMGAPIPEKDLLTALVHNLGSLDDAALKNALISALRKTLAAKNYDLETSKSNKTVHYRLVEKSHITITRLGTDE